jgi:hypothetical protein
MVGSKEAGVLLGDVVVDLVEGVADRELGGDLGDGEAGGLGRERRGAGDARVHLDDDEAPVLGVDGELHVRAAGLDPDLAQTAIEALRIIWYSLSVSVCAGATVIESPVWTPIGSTFSMEQTMMQLSARSRIDLHLELLPAEEGLVDQDLRGRARRRGRS